MARGGGGLTATYNAGTYTWTLSGAQPPSVYRDLLAKLTYTNTSSAPTKTDRRIDITVNDGLGNGNIATSVISVTAAPKVTLASTAQTSSLREQYQGGALLVAPAAELTLGNGSAPTSMSIELAGDVDAALESLSVSTAATTLSAQYDAVAGVLTVSGTGTAAAYQRVLRTLSYTNTATDITGLLRTVSVTVSTDTDTSVPVQATIMAQVPGAAPTVDLNGSAAGTDYSAQAIAEQAISIVDPLALLADVDSTTLQSLTASITNPSYSMLQRLSVDLSSATTGPITANYNAITRTLTLRQTGSAATLAQWQQALRTLSYLSGPDSGENQTYIVQVVANDGQQDSNAATVLILPPPQPLSSSMVISSPDTLEDGSSLPVEDSDTVSPEGELVELDPETDTLVEAAAETEESAESQEGTVDDINWATLPVESPIAIDTLDDSAEAPLELAVEESVSLDATLSAETAFTDELSLASTGGMAVSMAAATTATTAAPTPSSSATDNRITYYAYDKAGRLAYQIVSKSSANGATANNYVTGYKYDASSRQVSRTQYSTVLNSSSTSYINGATYTGLSSSITVTASSTNDRTERYFYDKDGNRLAALDADGYLTETVYDSAGQVSQQIAYSTVTDSTLRATGTLQSLRPAAVATADLVSWTGYDGHGRVSFTVDAQQYLTAYTYDKAGNRTGQTRYATPITYNGTQTLVNGLPPLTTVAGKDQTTGIAYDALNRITQETAADGTITQYTYDTRGFLTTKIAAYQQTDAYNRADDRTTTYFYDDLGRLTNTILGVGSDLYNANGQLAADADNYGTRNVYDKVGRKEYTIDPDGHYTWFYYDNDSRLRYTVNALYEVTETRYNAFGDVSATVAYATRLNGGAIHIGGGLLSSADAADFVGAVTTSAFVGNTANRTTSYTYGDNRGLLTQTVDALGFTTTAAYTAFGQQSSLTRDVGATPAASTRTDSYTYDKRGHVASASVDSTLKYVTSTVYDAFGRVVQSVDAKSGLTATRYDSFGRTVVVTDPLSQSGTTTYDAFSRVLAQTDRTGHATTYTYSNTSQTVTMTTAEGIIVTTLKNRHGQTIKVTDGTGVVTKYAYDKDGNLLSQIEDSASGGLKLTTKYTYDDADLLQTTKDAELRLTQYTYDVANRVLTRVVDPYDAATNPGGLNLTTRYAYDAFDGVYQVTDANGVVTETLFDTLGRQTAVIVDTAGLKLATIYTYDALSDVLTVKEGVQATGSSGAWDVSGASARTTTYAYDKLGRRIQQTEGFGSVNAKTYYAYDGNNNLTRKTDANVQLWRYAYDADNHQRFAIDPLGEVTEYRYDGEGRRTSEIQYSTIVDPDLLYDGITDEAVAHLLNAVFAQDLNTDTSGLTNPDGTYITYGSGKLSLTSGNRSSALFPAVTGTRTYVPSQGPVGFRAEVNTGTNSANRYFEFGANGNGNMVAVAFHGTQAELGKWMGNSGAGTIPLGTISDNTTYVVEVELTAWGGQVWLYKKGQARSAGYTASFSDFPSTEAKDAWSTNGFMAYICVGETPSLGTPGCTLTVDNIVEYNVDRSSLPVNQPLYPGESIYSLGGAYRLTYQKSSDGINGQLVLYTRAGEVRWQSTSGALGRALFQGDGNFVLYTASGSVVWSSSTYGNDGSRLMLQQDGNLVIYPITGGNAIWATNTAIATTSTSRTTRHVYDGDGREFYTIDPLNDVTGYQYDADGRVSRKTQYANPTPGQIVPTPVTSADDRVERRFYDAAGRLQGTLDGEGYLTERVYDATGRVKQEIRYANPTATGSRATGNFSTLKSGLANATYDQVTNNLYDAAGRLTGAVDAEGYLTQYGYDSLGNRTTEYRYGGKVVYSDSKTLATLALEAQGATPAGQSRAKYTALQYDHLNRLLVKTARIIDPDGVDRGITRTEYTYDALGHVETQTRAAENAATDSDYRRTTNRYDAAGRLVQTLDGVGSTLLAAAGTDVNAQNAVWTTYGTQYFYDALGHRRAERQNGHTNYYYYDLDGQLRYVVNDAGQVRETQYDAFGNASKTIQYAATVTTTNFDGGLLGTDPEFDSKLATLAADTNRREVSTTYTAQDLVDVVTDAQGYTVDSDYNAFGEVKQRVSDVGASHGASYRTDTYSYTRRGQLGQRVQDAGSLAITQALGYDAFGRLVQTTDARGGLSKTAYDRLDRAVQTTDAANVNAFVSYDAYSRTLTQTDRLGNVTTYTYDDVSLTRTIKTPEGIQTKITRNKGGDDWKIELTNNGVIESTVYTYDQNGRIKRITDPNANYTENFYDQAGEIGLLSYSVDKNGVQTDYRYDAVNRVLTRTIDPTPGLNLQTSYTYDAFGEAYQVTDQRGVVTETLFDKNGKSTAVIVDTAGLKLATVYSYDALGDVLTVKEGVQATGSSGAWNVTAAAARTTSYAYDKLGRLGQETIDSSNPPSTTQKLYDANNNVVRMQDANLNYWWYTYDPLNRLIDTVDPLGGVTTHAYDAEGRITKSTRFATPIAVPASTVVQLADSDVVPAANSSLDRSNWTFYDKDGRVAYEVDAARAVTGYTYDAAGRVLAKTRYSQVLAADPNGYTPLGIRMAPTTTLWSNELTGDPFASSTSGLTRSGNAITYDGTGQRLALTNSDSSGTSSASYVWGTNNRLLADEGRVVFASELTVASLTAAATYFAGADDPGNGNRYFLAAFVNGQVKVRSNEPGGAYTDLLLGNFTVGTTYYVEADISSDSATLYVYAKGTARANGWSYTRSMTWTQARTRIQVATNGVNTGNAAYVDNLYEYRAISQGHPSSQTTQYTYDAGGRLRSVKDAEGYTESYDYDNAGNRKSLTNKLTYKWNYEYDKANRLTEERANQITALHKITASGTEWSLTYVYQTTQYTYDELGNVIARKEGYKTTNSKDATFYEARRTSYFYDGRGLQTKIEYTAVGVYDSAGDASGNYSGRHDTSTILSTQTWYDGVGNAIASRDTAGRFSYKTYDAAGRVAFEIDAARGVTQYTYDGLGNVDKLTRYAATISETTASGGKTLMQMEGDITGGTSNAADNTVAERQLVLTAQAFANSLAGTVVSQSSINTSRTVDTDYDKLGRKQQVTQPVVDFLSTVSGGSSVRGIAAPTTVYVYNTLGDQTTESVRRRADTDGSGPITSDWATTYYGYDSSGNRTTIVDPLGYYTVNSYDAFGRLTRTYEYARKLTTVPTSLPNFSTLAAPAASSVTSAAIDEGYDRIAEFSYDRMNQVVQQRRLNVIYWNDDGNAVDDTTDQRTATLTRSTAYDALGRVSATTDETGAVRRTFYDEVGNVVATTEPVRKNELNVDVTPLACMTYDVLGNQISATRYINGASSSTSQPLLANAGIDQTTAYDYDILGRQTRITNAAGGVEEFSYDSAGHVAKDWRSQTSPYGNVNLQKTTLYSYDRVGRLSETAELIASTYGAAQWLRTQVNINAYGEQVNKTTYSSASYTLQSSWDEFGQYDAAGRLWQTNQGGVIKAYEFDLNGAVTAEVVVKGADSALGGAPDVSAARALASPGSIANAADTIRTEYVRDKLGRVTEQRQPSFVTDARTASDDEPVQLVRGLVWVSSSQTSIKTTTIRPPNNAEPYSQTTTYYSLNLAWDTLIGFGDGDVTVTVQYYAQYAPGVLLTQPGAIAGESAYGGMTLEWDDGGKRETYVENSILSIYSITVDKVLPNLTKQSLVRTLGGYTDRVELQVPRAFGTSLGSFQYRVAGSTGEFQPLTTTPVNASDPAPFAVYAALASSMNGVTYEYKIVINQTAPVKTGAIDANPAYGTYTGTFTVGGGKVTAFGPATVNGPPAAAAFTTAPVQTLALDRWGNAILVYDPRNSGWITRYAYNYQNQRVSTTLPTADVWKNDGNLDSAANYTVKSYYDARGLELGTRNQALSYAGRSYDAAGNVVTEIAPLTNNVLHRYDGLGREVGSTLASGATLVRSFDKLDRLTQVENQGISGGSVDQYYYDELGNRILVAEGGTTANPAGGINTCYLYDTAGHVVRVLTQMALMTGVLDTNSAFATRYSYYADGQKATEADGNAIAGQAAVQGWTYDKFGRVTTATDNAGVVTYYQYDGYGRLTRQTSTATPQSISYTNPKSVAVTISGTTHGDDLRYSYYGNGALKEVTDVAKGYRNVYEYDAAGNRVLERYINDVGKQTEQEARLSFDAQNRLVRVRDNRYLLEYGYDAVGNRRFNSSQYLATLNEPAKLWEGWYDYDSAGRMTKSQGALVGGQIVLQGGAIVYDYGFGADYIPIKSQGIQLSYDAAGRRATAERYDDSGSYYTQETYGYDAKDRLTAVSMRRIDAYTASNSTPQNLAAALAAAPNPKIVERKFDQWGRLTDYYEYDPANGSLKSHRWSIYNLNGWLIWQATYNGAGTLQSTMNFLNTGRGASMETTNSTGDGYDYVGNPLRYSLTTTTYVNVYDYAYLAWSGGYKEIKLTGTNTWVSSGTMTPGTTATVYDVNGQVSAVTQTGGTAQPARSFVADAQGSVYRKLEGTNTHYYYYAAGHGVGASSDDPNDQADFDYNYQPVTESYNVTSGKQTEQLYGLKGSGVGDAFYVVNTDGETLSSIASAYYGDARQWYRIADANGLSGSETLKAGTQLRIPTTGVTNLHNSSDTFKPYNPGEIVGDTTPEAKWAPPKPPKHHCNALAMVVIVAVVVVATIVTAGAAAVAAGAVASSAGVFAAGASALAGGALVGGASMGLGAAMAAAAVGGALGSIAGQLTGMALGVQDHFSWGQVAASGLTSMATAGIAGGMSQLASTSKLGFLGDANGWGGAARGAATGFANSVAGQGVNMALGQQDHFSWSGVAAASITGGVGGALGDQDPLNKIAGGTGPQAFSLGNVAGNTVRSTAYGVFNRRVQMLMGHGGKLGFANIAADSFGNALGNSIVGAMQSSAAEEQMQQQADKRRAEQIARGMSGNDSGFSFADDGGFNLTTGEAPSGLLGANSGPKALIDSAGQLVDPSTVDLQWDEERGQYWYTAHPEPHTAEVRYVDPSLDQRIAGLQNWLDDRVTAAQDIGAQAYADGNYLGAMASAGLYGAERIGVNFANGLLGLPRLVTNPDMLPGLFNAVANPLDTASRIGSMLSTNTWDENLLLGTEVIGFGGSRALTSAGAIAWDAATSSAQSLRSIGSTVLENWNAPRSVGPLAAQAGGARIDLLTGRWFVTDTAYRERFAAARPDLPDDWQVHHSIPQRYQLLFEAGGIDIHELQYLRGVSSPVHSQVTTQWGRFHSQFNGNPTAADVARFAAEIDRRYEGRFMWPGY